MDDVISTVDSEQVAMLIALSFRALTMFLLLGLLPNRIVPLSLRFALAVSMILFCAPIFHQSNLELGDALVLFSNSLSSFWYGEKIPAAVDMPSFSECVFELAFGAFLAVGIATAGYVAELVASLLYVSTIGGRDDEQVGELRSRNLVSHLVLILFLCVLFHSIDISTVWLLLGKSLSLRLDEALFFSVVIRAGSTAFAVSLLILLPYFFLAFSVDFMMYWYLRYFPQGFFEGLMISSRGVLLVLALAMGVYSFSSDIARTLDRSLEPAQVDALLNNR